MGGLDVNGVSFRGGFAYLGGKPVFVGSPSHEFTFQNNNFAGTLTFWKAIWEENGKKDFMFKKHKKYSGFEYSKNDFEDRASKRFG